MTKMTDATLSDQSSTPVAWVIPGTETARDDGSIDAKAWREGEFTKPLYAATPSPSPRAAVSTPSPEGRLPPINLNLYDLESRN